MVDADNAAERVYHGTTSAASLELWTCNRRPGSIRGSFERRGRQAIDLPGPASTGENIRDLIR